MNWLGVIAPGNVGFALIEFTMMMVAVIFCYRTFHLYCRTEISLAGTAIVMLQLFVYFETGNMVEEYALPFIFVALYIFARYFMGRKTSMPFVLLCGFCFGCVLLLRPNMIALWVVFAIAVIIKEHDNLKKLGLFILCFTAGVLLALLPCLLYLFINHAFFDFLDQYFLFNFRYSTASLQDRLSGIAAFGCIRGNIIALAFSALMLLQERDKSRLHLCLINLIYMLVNLIFVSISGKTFLHYGMVLIPAYVLPYAFLLGYLQKRADPKKCLAALVASIMLLSIPYFIFLYSDIGQKNADRYNNAESTAASIIREYTKPEDKIISCGNCDYIYLSSEREAASKYSYQLPIADQDPSIYEAFLRDLNENHPEVIVRSTNTLGGVIDYTNLNAVIDHYLQDYTYYKWCDIGPLTLLGKHPIDSDFFSEMQ